MCSAPQPHGWCGVLATAEGPDAKPGKGSICPQRQGTPSQGACDVPSGRRPLAASVLLGSLPLKSSFNQKQKQQNKRVVSPPNALWDRPCPSALVSSSRRDCSCLRSFWRLRAPLALWLHHFVSAHALPQPSPASGSDRPPLFIRMSVTSFRIPPPGDQDNPPFSGPDLGHVCRDPVCTDGGVSRFQVRV